MDFFFFKYITGGREREEINYRRNRRHGRARQSRNGNQGSSWHVPRADGGGNIVWSSLRMGELKQWDLRRLQEAVALALDRPEGSSSYHS